MARGKAWQHPSFGMLDPAVIKRMDNLRAFLALHWPLSHLVELHEVFGDELLAKFMETFAGMVVRVPSKAAVEQAIRDHDIYRRLKERAPAADLAKAYGISVKTVYEINRRVAQVYSMLEGTNVLREEDEAEDPFGL